MLRAAIVLIGMGICALFLYQTPQKIAQDSATAKQTVAMDTSILKSLENAVPKGISEKEIKPLLKRHEENSSSQLEVDDLVRKLRTIGDGLEKNNSEKVNKVLEAIAPKKSAESNILEHASSFASSLFSRSDLNFQISLHDFEEMASGLLQGLINAFSRLLELAAGQLSHK